jgi:hypothetical protein
MASYGFSSDHVNLIADNLRDRYKNGFPILKELIQNADDAKALRLAFGLHPGFRGHANHMLLQGPGLWVFNDGEFKPEDEKAIRSFGLNSKAGDSGSIGKFGLGMKSVFHLCEAFFYVAYDGKKSVDVFLNPWHDLIGNDQFHTSWAEVSQIEFDSIRSVVTDRQLSKDCSTWFFLWIPLRQVGHVPHQDGKPIGAIVDKYPGDPGSVDLSFLLDPGLGMKVRSVVPLLRNLKTIELVNSHRDGKEFNGFRIEIAVNKGSKRVDHSSPDLQSAGAVTGGVPSKGKMWFLIQQKSLIEDMPFGQFQKLNAWPKTGSLTREGKREAVPDKSDAEGAVMVARAPADGERAKLDIQWAVFLPTEEGLNYEVCLDKSVHNYRIVLHGQFFVDAGRRGIAGSAHLSDQAIAPAHDLDDTDLHTGWNQAVAQRVVLPMFLPTVAQYAAEHLNPLETEELARAILEARSAISHSGGFGKGFWDTFKNHICDGQAWVRLVTPNGPQWSLERVNADTRLLRLPPPPRNDAKRPWQVLPGLTNLVAQGCLFLDDSAPSLLRTYSNWENETLLELLLNLDQQVACTETGMTYLVSFLKLERERYVDTKDTQRALISILQNMLRREDLQRLRGMRSVLQELIAIVKPVFRFALGPVGPQSGYDEALKLLLDVNVTKLLLPKDLDPGLIDSSEGVPTEDEICALLSSIDHRIDQYENSDKSGSTQKINALLRASTDILRLLPEKGKTGDERGATVRANRSLRILTAICARTGSEMAVSLSDLNQGHENGLVFKREAGAGSVTYPVATELAKLIPSEQIWVVSGEISKWIQSANDTPPVPSATDSNAAYSALGKLNRPRALSGKKNGRVEFIQKVSPIGIKNEEMIRGYRYVLHGVAAKHSEIEMPLWINADRGSEVWIKLKRMVDPDPWNFVDPQLSAVMHLRREDEEKCCIKNLGPEEVLAYLKKQISPDNIIPNQFDESERAAILSRITDDDLWKAMPLHPNSKGQFSAITKFCFLDSAENLASSLTDGCHFFKLSDNPELRARQKLLIPKWTHRTTIERALAQTNPADHCYLILNAISQLSVLELNTIAGIKSIKWLPLKQLGRNISPEDVIDIESLEGEIDRLSAENNYCFAGVSALFPAITDHPDYCKLRHLFAQKTDALQRLGQLMAESDLYRVGDFSLLEHEKLNDYLYELANLSSMPGWRIVKLACDVDVAKDADFAVAEVQQFLLPEIRKPLEASRLKQVLIEISNLVVNKKVVRIFNIYLKHFASDIFHAKSAISSINLLNCDNGWQKAECLCAGVEGVSPANLLIPEQVKILKDIIHSGAVSDTLIIDDFVMDSRAKDSVHELEEYFKVWRDSMPVVPIGGFFALLGPAFQKLAIDWIKPHSVENLIDSIEWKDPSDRNSPVWDYTKSGGYQKREAFNMLHFIPVITDGDEIATRSIIGSPMKVPRSKRYDNLIVGNITWAGTRTGLNAFKLPLRLLSLNDLAQTDKSQLTNLIRNTCATILREAYNQRSTNIEAWLSLENSDQLELEVARELILDRLPYDLRNIKTTRQNALLRDALEELENLETDRADRRNRKQSISEVERSIGAAKINLANLMINDPKVQLTILKGIRRKVKENQYRESSVPFELLQNADDAVVELKSLMRDGGATNYSPRTLSRFVVESNDMTLRFLHWGRPVNFMGNGAGRNDSYGKDLQRMLVLSASDKDDSSAVTGKFGLGFKSVLLTTDMPCLVSGDLKVRILGGCLPAPWPEADGALRALQTHRLADVVNPRGTVIEFRVSEGVHPDAVLKRFSALAGLQCVFSKEIRSINVNEQLHCWSPASLSGIPGTEVGRVHLPAKDGVVTARLLTLRLKQACLAFRLDSRGCAIFSTEGDFSPPGVWVTAPTSEAAAAGVILNGPFVVDTGRGGLPHGEGAVPNLKLAEEFGREVAVLVSQMVTVTRKTWPDASANLELNKDVTAGEFWSSFLMCILMAKDRADTHESERLLGRMGSSFYEKYLANTDEVPNGLSRKWSGFVQLTRINLSLNTRWQKEISKLEVIAALIDLHPMEGWVSETVAQQLRNSYSFRDRDVPAMSVGLLLDCIPQSRFNPVMINSLAGLLTQLNPDEENTCSSKLKQSYFYARDGNWKLGVHLLKPDCPEDAPYIAFAPDSALIDTAYEGVALEVLNKFAPCEKIETITVAKWILDASSNDSRVSALRYLLLDQRVRLYVGLRFVGSWLQGLGARSQYLSSFSISDKNLLLVMFKTDLVENEETVWPYEPQPILLQGHEALQAIYKWWQVDGDQQLKRFYHEFWPNEVLRNFSDESDNRAAWMTLFAIGLMQRFGRVQNNQNRGYIEHMQSKGWWDVFSSVDPHEDGQAWLNVLNEYGELQVDDEKFGMWMETFPRLYRVARWFSEYKHQFESLDYRTRSESSDLLSIGADPVLSGSDIYAPTLIRGLRHGQHVIVRELLRNGVLRSETAKSLAFKPGSRVRSLLSSIGFVDLGGEDVKSQNIYDALRDCLGDAACFDDAFDIPLQIMALDSSLQQQILGAVAIQGGESDEY